MTVKKVVRCNGNSVTGTTAPPHMQLVMARQHAKKLSAGTHVIRRSLKDGACRSLEASSALRGIARKDANARQGLGVSVRPAKKLRAGTRLIRRSLRDGAYHAPQPRAYSSLGGCGELIQRGSGGGEKLAQKLFAGKRTIRRSLKDGACAYRSVEACGKRRFKELGDAGAGRGSEAHGTPVMARRHARKLSAGTRMIRRNLRERAYRSLKARGELGGSGRGQLLEAHERPAKRLRTQRCARMLVTCVRAILRHVRFSPLAIAPANRAS